MSIQQKEFTRFIKLLSDNDCLRHVILVGSWAEYIYEQTGLLKGFDANIKTLDIDFLLINLRKPNPPKNISILAKEAGYIVQNDVLDGTTKILDKEGLEIEFLINKVGAGLESTLRTNLGVVAQSLRHMDVILRHKLEIDYLGININAPVPEAYVLHKIIINTQRKAKQEKDRLAIIHMWEYLDKGTLVGVYNELTKKEQKTVNDFLTVNNLQI